MENVRLDLGGLDVALYTSDDLQSDMIIVFRILAFVNRSERPLAELSKYGVLCTMQT